MRARTAVIAVAAGVPLLIGAAVGCGGTASPPGTGPLGLPAEGGGICLIVRPGETFTDAEITDINKSSAPVTITKAWLTGIRHMTVDAIYADDFTVGSLGPAANADWYGQPPTSLRHPARRLVVPAGKAVVFLFTVTGDGPDAYFGGQDISYTSQGQSYMQANPRFLGHGRNC
jgi:hypothetical protein